MKGEISSLIKALVVLALVIGIVSLIAFGSKAIIAAIKGNSAELISTVNDTFVDENMAKQCKLAFQQCCALAEGDRATRTDLCMSVLGNTLYDMGDGDPVACIKYFEGIC